MFLCQKDSLQRWTKIKQRKISDKSMNTNVPKAQRILVFKFHRVFPQQRLG